MYYIDSQKNLFKFDLGQVALGRIGGPDVVLDGEKIADNLEEIAVERTKGTIYTLQSSGIVGKIGSAVSNIISFRVPHSGRTVKEEPDLFLSSRSGRRHRYSRWH